MIEAEADALNILSKMKEAEEAPMPINMREVALNTREGALGGNIVIEYVVAEVAKENPKKAAKNMTEAGADAPKMLSKTMEVAEVPMATEKREAALKTR